MANTNDSESKVGGTAELFAGGSGGGVIGGPQNPRRRPKGLDFEMVQAHYDVSDAFYALFLDPTMTYSCAKFDAPTSTLQEAQLAKIDLSLSKCDLHPGQTLLDIGCGWGATARRAREKYDVNVIGLTLSKAQFEHDQREEDRRLQNAPGNSSSKQTRLEFRLQGWETFEDKVDRIVSIGAFEHFGRAKYAQFFAKCRTILPDDGTMLLHTITAGRPSMNWDFLRFAHFIATEIFPGGDVPPPEAVIGAARQANFELVHVESLRPHYARTLDAWAANLETRKREAVNLVGQVIVDKYMRYLTGCADLFRNGECNLHQFRFRATGTGLSNDAGGLNG